MVHAVSAGWLVGMSQIPRGDTSNYIVQFTYDMSQRSTYQRYVDELNTFVDGKLHTRFTVQYIQWRHCTVVLLHPALQYSTVE